MKTQPDEVTCGPTSLHAIYQYYGDSVALEEVIEEVKQLETGGTIAVFLGEHALARGYEATLYVYNLDVFDPTWFHPRHFSSEELIVKLEAQMHYKAADKRIRTACRAYCDFLKAGGIIQTKDLTVTLLQQYFNQDVPILAGLNCTYLYQCARELILPDGNSIMDDVRGTLLGHFVVLAGYDETHRHVVVADPHMNPLSHDNYYRVSSNRLIHSILLGTVTHDANLLIIRPKSVEKVI